MVSPLFSFYTINMKVLGKPINFILKLVAIGVFLVVACPLFAQVGRGLGRGMRAGIRAPKPVVTFRTLKERVNTSYQKALQAQQQYPEVFINVLDGEGPAKHMFLPIYNIKAERLYPDKPFLAHNPANLNNYFMANQNRHISYFAPQIDALQKSWRANIPKFLKSQIYLSQNDMHWLAGQIPSNISYLLLGESHHEPDISRNIAQLLQELRLQQPTREIIFLTELRFQKNAMKELASLMSPTYEPIWRAAQKNNISIVGMEPTFSLGSMRQILEKVAAKKKNSVTYRQKYLDIWLSLEGIRIRNANWLGTIEQIHQQHPDALLIIHGGDFHIRTWYPFSLGTALKNRPSFIISFLTQNEKTPFDNITNKQFKFPGVLSFKDKELRELFGTDVEIRVPSEYSPYY